jgi:hypothetical protein
MTAGRAWTSAEDAIALDKSLTGRQVSERLAAMGHLRSINAVELRRFWLARRGDPTPKSSGSAWVEAEDAVLRDRSLTARQVAERLEAMGHKRSLRAVEERRGVFARLAARAAAEAAEDAMERGEADTDWPCGLRFEDDPLAYRAGIPVMITGRLAAPRSAMSSLLRAG